MDWLQSPLLFKNRHSRAVAIRCRARVCSVCSLTIVFMVSNMPCWMISISSTCDFCVSFFRGRFLGGSCDAAWSDEVAASAGGSLSFSGAFDESMPPFTDSTPITSMILRQFFLEVVGAARLRFSVFRHYVWRSPSHSTWCRSIFSLIHQ